MPEPVFGIIKSVLGFRQFLLRGLDKVRGEWSLVTMAWNLKRMFTLCSRPVGRGEGLLPQNEGDRDRYRHSRAEQDADRRSNRRLGDGNFDAPNQPGNPSPTGC